MYKTIRFPNFRLKALTLSYDDANRQDKRLISIMKEHGLKGTFNINSGAYGGQFTGEETGRMSRQEAIELYSNCENVEVAIHGFGHFSLTNVSSEALINDIVTDRKDLEKTYNRVVKGMAYAYSDYNDEVVQLLKTMGIDYARTGNTTYKFDMPTDWLKWNTTCHHKDPRLMDLAKEFVNIQELSGRFQNHLQLFYLWGHSYEFDAQNNWNTIEDFAKFMGNRDDIWYATNGEIYNYMKAAHSLRYSIGGGFVENPSAQDIYLNYFGLKRVVPAGKTIRIDDGEIM